VAAASTLIIEPRRGWRPLDWRELAEYRDLLYYLVLREVTVLYKQTVLGFAWALLTPFFSMVVFTVIFGKLVGVTSDGAPYAIFAYVALLPWTYFASALTSSSGSLIQSSALFTKVYFPRMFMPLVPVFAKLVDFAVAALLLAALMIWYQVVPSARILALPILLALLMATATGLGLWSAALAVQYRDVRHAMPAVTQLLMYAAPVVWPVSMIPAEYRAAYGLYPMAGVIEGFRSAVLGTTPMPWDLIGVGSASALVILVTGTMYFRRTERIFADVA
jgi:lipopolysaccharide transport system permease protein